MERADSLVIVMGGAFIVDRFHVVEGPEHRRRSALSGSCGQTLPEHHAVFEGVRLEDGKGAFWAV